MSETPDPQDAACRAEIPSMLSEEERNALAYTPRCRQRWGARQTEAAPPPLASEDVGEFLTEFAWLKENELALQCLFDSDFDVPRAVRLLHAGRRERRKAQRDQDKRLKSDAFEDAVKTLGKRFHLVQQALGKKVTTREVVSKYYLWKRSAEYSEWQNRQKNNKKKKREVARLHWGEETESEKDTTSDYHNERCELCSTGGRLLCCDGCARAFHFSCVSMMVVPDRDWYCVYCQEVMGARPKLIPSDENPHCLVPAPFPGTLAESISNGSSYAGGGSSLEGSDGRSDGGISDYPSQEELSSDIDNLEAHDDLDDSVHGSTKRPLSQASGDTNPPAEQQNPAAEAPLVVSRSPEQPGAAPSPFGVRSVQLPAAGRKRHRKTVAPRRIPQPNN